MHSTTHNYRTWIELDTHALNHNIGIISQHIGANQKLGAVIKSNAYGHGLILMGRLLDEKPEISLLLTAGLQEALELRKNGIKKPMLAMSYIDTDPLLAINNNIQLPISHRHQLENLSRIAQEHNVQFDVHLKIDTGLSRLGISACEAHGIINEILENEHLNLKGIFTHLADNKNEEQSYGKYQLDTFKDRIKNIPAAIRKNLLIHAQASASLYAGPYDPIFNMIRIGSALYGMYKSPMQERSFHQNSVRLLPLLSWKTSIIEIKKLPALTPISYGCKYITTRETTIAIAPVGYWDGYKSGLSGSCVYINGQKAIALGAITMNMIILDITDIQEVRIGDPVSLIGGHAEITAQQLAANAGCVNLELLSGIHPMIPRFVALQPTITDHILPAKKEIQPQSNP